MDRKVYEKFFDLSGRLSPENLTCDGGLSRAQSNQRYRAIMKEWHKLETKLGRTVTEDEIWSSYLKEQGE